jgi:two-component system, NtrC family, response regulator HydG
MPKTLIIDDDQDISLLLGDYLLRRGFKVLKAQTGSKALEIIQSEDDLDLVLCDHKMNGTDGKDILLRIREKDPALPVILVSDHHDLRAAVELMKLGAYDYVLKPLFPEDVMHTIEAALTVNGKRTGPAGASTEASISGQNGMTQLYGFGNDYIFGKSPIFLQLLEQIKLVSPTDYSVLIYGESGSGKEAIAQEIHKQSTRASKPFVAIDCGALSRDLAGSELFGHEKGAFTGAINQKKGSFELANGGTIFLDEIANLSYDIQVSLLRVVQERRLRRIGGTRDIPIDVRIIISSNEPLWDAVRKGKFREDLYHRFNEFPIEVPPLRMLKEDIMIFAAHFLAKANQSLGKHIKGFSPEVEAIFRKYVWYGNLRELSNVVKRAALLAEGEHIQEDSIPLEICNHDTPQDADEPPPDSAVMGGSQIPDLQGHLGQGNRLKEASLHQEYAMILKTLKEVNFNKSKAARILNIDRKTLYNKINAYKALGNPH